MLLLSREDRLRTASSLLKNAVSSNQVAALIPSFDSGASDRKIVQGQVLFRAL